MLTGKHILIADDDPDGREFIDQSFIPDYIFLDLNMPLMDGNECLQRLKQAERLQNIPVIICSTTKAMQH